MNRCVLNRAATRLVAVCAFLALIAGPVFAEPSRIVIFSFHLESRQNLLFLADGVCDMLESRLYHRDQVEIVRCADAERAMGEHRGALTDEAIRGIATALKADYALTGSVVEQEDGSLKTTARMIGFSGAGVLFDFNVTGSGISDLLQNISALAAEINQRVFHRSPKKDSPDEASGKTPVNLHAHPETIVIEE